MSVIAALRFAALASAALAATPALATREQPLGRWTVMPARAADGAAPRYCFTQTQAQTGSILPKTVCRSREGWSRNGIAIADPAAVAQR